MFYNLNKQFPTEVMVSIARLESPLTQHDVHFCKLWSNLGKIGDKGGSGHGPGLVKHKVATPPKWGVATLCMTSPDPNKVIPGAEKQDSERQES